MPRFIVDCNGIERVIDAERIANHEGALHCYSKDTATVAIFAAGQWRLSLLTPSDVVSTDVFAAATKAVSGAKA